MYRYFIIGIVIIGCNFQDNAKTPSKLEGIKNLTTHTLVEKSIRDISLKKDLTIVDSSTALIGSIGDIVVDSIGRIFIADLEQRIIHIYDSQGTIIAQLGGEGSGPSEFSYLKSLQISNHFLYAIDSNFGIRRVIKFNLDNFDEQNTTLLAKNRKNYSLLNKAYPGIYRVYIMGDHSYLAEFVVQDLIPTKDWDNVELTGLLYTLDSTGNIKSNLIYEFEEAILVNKAKALITPIRPFFGSSFIFISKKGDIYLTDPQLFIIKKFNSEGIYERAFYYPIQDVLLTQESAAEAGLHEYFIQNMKFIKDLPSSWPVIRDMKIDDEDRIWVGVTVNNMFENEWWILNSSGNLITRFRMPKNKSIGFIRGGYIYTLETNLNTGLQQVVRYKFELI